MLPAKRKRSEFAKQAVSSFTNVHQALFKQASEEINRLDRTNSALKILEDTLLDPERVSSLGVAQQISLLEVLYRSQQMTLRNIWMFSNTLTRVRQLVAIHEGLDGEPINIIQGEVEVERLGYENTTDFVEK